MHRNCSGKQILEGVITAEYSARDIRAILGRNCEDAHAVLEQLSNRFSPRETSIVLLVFVAKQLVGTRIAEVFADVCGEDLDRFYYHLCLELPCQRCGMFFHFEHEDFPLEGNRTLIAHYLARTYGTPESNWALANPPETPHYTFPIVVPVDQKELEQAEKDIGDATSSM